MRKGQAMLRQRGFTLIELVTVLAILGVLMALLLPTVNARGYAQQAPCMSNLHQIGLAFSMYLEDYGRRPADITDLAVGGYVPPEVLVCPADPTGDQGGKVCREDHACALPPAPFPTSYIYLSPRRTDDLWSQMEALGARGSYLICQCHGHRREGWGPPGHAPCYEGKVLRLSFDGSVHVGHTHWAHGDNWQQIWNVWKAFTDEPEPERAG
jgi:prepilin-type N-terminal cleavage/methylation domain-containing protein